MQVIPSQEQEAILQSRAPTLMIEARAGTGKTTTLAMLAAREHGVVLGLCFSDGARIRFEDKLRDEAPGRKATVLTVEGLARSLLNRLIQAGFFDKPARLASAEQLRPHVVDAANAVWGKYEQRGGSEFDFDFEYRTPRIEQMLELLSTLKATLASLAFDDEDFDDYAVEELAERFNVDREAIEICREIERRRQPQQGYIVWQSPPDLVTDLVAILRREPHTLDALPQADVCLVDEWHDVNAAEFELLRLFRRAARLAVVGDRHQVINAARGADPKFSAEAFDQAWPGALRLPLSQSRRCGVSIAKLLRQVLPACRFESHSETYSELRRVQYAPGDCAAAVAERAAALAADGVKLSDVAVVLREADQTVDIENLLLDRAVPYVCDGVESYLLRPEILMLRALLHIASGDYSTLQGDKESCERMVDSLLVYLSVSAAGTDWETGHEIYGSGNWLELARHDVVAQPSALDNLFSGVLCADKEGDSPTSTRWKQRFRQVVQLLKERAPAASAPELLALASQALDLPAATRTAFVSRSRADSALRTIRAFIEFAERRGKPSAADFLQELKTRQERTRAEVNYLRERRQLVLTTVQAAKGREWPQVLLPCLEQGQFPRGGDLAEERRYFYVAASRAIAGLTLFEPDEQNAARRSALLS
jgi:DNA helicase-2/ATP-dependent DNA helicase PcrA